MPGVRIFMFNAPLHFANSQLFQETLFKKCIIDVESAKLWMASNSETPLLQDDSQVVLEIGDQSSPPACSDLNGNEVRKYFCSF